MRMINLKVSKRSITIIPLFVLLLFIMCLRNPFSIGILNLICNHIDEMITLLLLLYVFLNYKIALIIDKRIITYWLLISFISLAGNLIFGYQSFLPAIVDCLIICPRFLIGYYACLIYEKKNNICVIKYIIRTVKIITVCLFVISVNDFLFTPIFARNEFRYFAYSLQLMFPHPTYLAFCGVTLLIILGATNNKNKNICYMLMASFLLFVTLRSKAIGFLILYWIFYIWFIILKRNNIWFISGIGGLVVIYSAWEQILLTFLIPNRFSPRSLMLKDGFAMMIKHFPFGTGFGTFGSSIARDYYSPLYLQLGYSALRGLSIDDGSFLTDNFWPVIFSQFGFIGTVLFIVITIRLIKKSLNVLHLNRLYGFSMLMILMYLFITSLAEASFFNPCTFLLMMVFASLEGMGNAKNIR